MHNVLELKSRLELKLNEYKIIDELDLKTEAKFEKKRETFKSK